MFLDIYMRKILPITILIILIISIVILLFYFCIIPGYCSGEGNFVLDQESGLYFEKGKILVSFKDDASDADISQLLSEYRIEITNKIVWGDNGRKVASIKVPVGKEKYYISILKETPIVNDGQLNYAH